MMRPTSPFFFAERKRIVELAGKHRLPAIYSQKEYVEGRSHVLRGGLQ